MIIDIHTHIGFNLKRAFHNMHPFSQTATDLLLKMNFSKIDYSVVFPFETTMYDNPNYYNNLISTNLMKFPYEKENEVVLSQTKAFGKRRLLPFLAIDPKRKIFEQLTHLDSVIKKDVIYGIKVHTKSTKTKANYLQKTPFMEFFKKNSLPVIFHSYLQNTTSPIYVLELATLFPDINFCVAHAAGFSKDFYTEIKKTKLSNLFLDTSPFSVICKFAPFDAKKEGVKILDLDYDNPEKAMKQLFEIVGDKLIFGSDEPFTTYVNKKDVYYGSLHSELQLTKKFPNDDHFKLNYKNALRFLGNRASNIKPVFKKMSS